MPKLITAILCKDEKDKYLERVLRRCLEFSDEVLVLDDGSTDGSPELAESLGCQVRRRVEIGMWGNESPARQELWQWASEVAGDGWVLVCDADMELIGDPRPLTYSTQHNAFSWVLYDLWDEQHFRCDGYWQGHLYARPWMFCPTRLGYKVPIWPERGLHTGHCPANSIIHSCVLLPTVIAWKHLGYASPSLRVSKHGQYMAKANQLSPFELAHAQSIIDS